MRLIVIAHRGEAQAFIPNLELKSIFERPSFYMSDDKQLGLLISGEGIYDVLTKLPFIIGKFSVTEITNLGIAGSLDANQAKVGEIYPIRTAYGHNESTPFFHSYTSKSESRLDCITSHSRVINNEQTNKLRNFASIVDRELWAIAKVASEFKLPFTAYKLISDIAGDETNCFDIKDQAKTFSETLLDNFIKNKSPEIKDTQAQQLPSELSTASFTQQKRILKLTHTLKVLFQKDLAHYLSNYDGEITHKKDINSFCEYLENKISPQTAILKNDLEKMIAPLKKIGAQVQLDKKMESCDITIQMKVNNEKNIQNLIRNLQEFSFSDWQKKWNGDV